MYPDVLYPTGEHLLADWTETDARDVGLIRVPDSADPVVVEWAEYRYQGRRQFLGTFAHGGHRLGVREQFEHVLLTDRATHCRRFRCRRAERVCCTEIALALASGKAVELERVERGAYRGLWRLDVYRRIRPARHLLGPREMACRAYFNLARRTATLFRWHFRDARS